MSEQSRTLSPLSTPDARSGSDSSWSVPTLIGGGVAAASATLLSSRLGLLGTLVGAVLVSVVTTIVGGALSGWLERARGAVVEPLGQGRKGNSSLHPDRRRMRAGAARIAITVFTVVVLVLAWRTGSHLLLDGLPPHSFAARFAAQFR